ncbi:MAG: hypothetical protein KA210_01330 [Bacteroidia bacterium]|nr:hypothetical protein [Bacteroidia bacterium]
MHFLDEVMNFMFEANNDGAIHYRECVNLKNEILLPNKKEQIFINEKGF